MIKIKTTDEKTEDARKKFLQGSSDDYTHFKEQRDKEGFDTEMQVMDGMYRCMKNRSLADQEAHAAMGTDSDGADDPKSNLGSIRFHRQVNQDGATFSSLINALPLPWEYAPRTNPNIFGDELAASDSTAVATAVAQYSWDQSGSSDRVLDVGHQLGKYGNVPIRAVMSGSKRRIKVYDHDTQKAVWKDMMVDAYPDWECLHWQNVYADLWGGPIEKQNCVIHMKPVTFKDVHQMFKDDKISVEAYDLFKEKHETLKWNGAEGSDFRKEQLQNQGGEGDDPSTDSALYLLWEIYRWAPIKKGEWSSDNDYELFYANVVGNALDEENVMLSLVGDFDADNEIPLLMLHSLPDDIGLLYHMPSGSATRQHYAVESTLWNYAIDNGGAITEPMLLWKPEALVEEVKDLRFKKGQELKVDINHRIDDVIREFSPANNIESMARLIGMIQGEQQVAGNTSANQQGENFGGRTAATEVMMINRLSQQPALVMSTTAIKKFLRFIGRKNFRMAQMYMPKNVIAAVANEKLDHPVFVQAREGDNTDYFPANAVFYGDFDVKLDVLDEFQEDFLAAQMEFNLLTQVGQNPRLAESDTHKVDVGVWLKSIMQRQRIKKVDQIIGPGGGNDARLRQREELRVMIEQGISVPVSPEDNDDQHLAEIRAWEIEWGPVIGLNPDAPELGELDGPEGTFARRVIANYQTHIMPHREQHKAQRDGKRTQAEASAQAGQMASPPNADTVLTEGQAAGVSSAAASGASAR